MRGKIGPFHRNLILKNPQPPVKVAGENFAVTLDYCRELLEAEALT